MPDAPEPALRAGGWRLLPGAWLASAPRLVAGGLCSPPGVPAEGKQRSVCHRPRGPASLPTSSQRALKAHVIHHPRPVAAGPAAGALPAGEDTLPRVQNSHIGAQKVSVASTTAQYCKHIDVSGTRREDFFSQGRRAGEEGARARACHTFRFVLKR